MTSKKLSDELPPIPSSLKSISSYIQRADELRAKDPIMAYWCTYYAAQLGLDLKSHEVGARDYLLAVITLLEGMKKELEGNDAVEHEAAGAAYVENFALKVFTLADNEDRRGDASRSTAKKFLAAANFLELLRVFEKSNNAEVNEEKVRYAKWKASEISKAFREGRQPTPGSAFKGEGASSDTVLPESTPIIRTPADRSPAGAPHAVLSPEAGLSNAQRRTPPSALKQLPGYVDVPINDAPHSATWSTVATPGSEAVGPSMSATTLALAGAVNRWKAVGDTDTFQASSLPEGQHNGTEQGRIDASTRKVHFSPSVVGGMSSTDGSPPPSPNPIWRDSSVSTPFSGAAPAVRSQVVGAPRISPHGRPDPSMMPLPDSSPSGSSHASPEGSPRQDYRKTSGRLKTGSSPPTGSVVNTGSSHPSAVGTTRNSPPRPRPSSLQASAPPPPPVIPVSGSHGRSSSISNRNSPSASANVPLPLYPVHPPPLPPNTSNLSSSPSYTSAAPGWINGSPNLSATSGLPPFPAGNPASSHVANYAPKPHSPRMQQIPVPTPPVELTPAVIAKAQKHCRFAISSLEYEDPEQARKELRAALALLGDG